MFVTSFALFLGLVFAAAAVHKLLLLRQGKSLDVSSGPGPVQRHPRLITASLVAIEGIVVALLVVVPVWGLIAGLGLFVAYTVALSKSPPEADCGCFGGALESTATWAIRRNLVLTVATGAAVAGGLLSSPAPVSATTAGVALLLGACGYGADQAIRVVKGHQTAISP